MEKDLLRFRKDLKLLFFDFETYNLNLSCPDMTGGGGNRVWQCALLEINGSDKPIPTDLLITYEGDEFNIGAVAAQVTGYWSKKMAMYGGKTPHEQRISNGTDIKDAFKIIKEKMNRADYIIAHNGLGFDVNLLNWIYKMHGENCLDLIHKFIDTNCIAKAVEKNIKKDPDISLIEFQYKLYHKKMKGVRTNQMALCKKYDIEVDEDLLHNAIYDLEINSKIWDKLKWKIDI